MADENSELIIDEFFTNDTDDTIEDNENTEQNDKTEDIANQVSDSEHSQSLDPTSLPSDGYTEDTSADGGEAGEAIEEQTQPASLENLPIRYKMVTTIGYVQLDDYTSETISTYRNAGKQAVAFFNDGTIRQVSWDDVFDPSTLARPAIKSEVLELLEATNQHFWNDTNGVHVNDDTKDSWDTEYAKENHGTLNTPTSAKPWHNILVNSFGILLRRGLVNHVSVTESAIAFYDGAGNGDQNIIANFGATTAQIGKSSARHISLTNSGLDILNGSGVSQAFFGATARIGASNAAHAIVNDNGLFVYDANGNLAKINAVDIVAVNEATQTAVTKSNEAAQAASNAETSASQAAASASNAETSASNAESSASQAASSASNAQSSASQAASSASNAANSASQAASRASNAESSASQAASSASRAASDASSASASARNALRGLDTVQDVVNITKWIADHKVLTNDTTPQSGVVYYSQNSSGQISKVDPYDVTTHTYPHSGTTYYTYQNGEYIKFTGSSFASGTTYYTAQNPKTKGYYVLDEKVANYLASHLVQTNYGLNLLVDNIDTYVNIGTVDGNEPIGFHIIDENGVVIQSTTENYIKIGQDPYIYLNDSGMSIYDSSSGTAESVARFNTNGATIGRANANYMTIEADGIYGWNNNSLIFGAQNNNGVAEFYLGQSRSSVSTCGGLTIYDANSDFVECLACLGGGMFYTSASMYEPYSRTSMDFKPASTVPIGRFEQNSTFDEYKLYNSNDVLYLRIIRKDLGTSSTRTGISANSYVVEYESEYYEFAWFDGSGTEVSSEHRNTYITTEYLVHPQSYEFPTNNGILMKLDNGTPSIRFLDDDIIPMFYRAGWDENSDQSTLPSEGVVLNSFNKSLWFCTSDSIVPIGNVHGQNSTASIYGIACGDSVYASGSYSHAEGYTTTSSGNYAHAEGYYAKASGVGSHAEGYGTSSEYTEASRVGSHAEGYATKASGDYSHSEGYKTTASGISSHAEGYNTKASNMDSHAEGDTTTASGKYSHAEGYQTTSLGDYSHAEGYQTTASKQEAHSEGYYAKASGNGSHAEGYGTSSEYTEASGVGSHAEGYATKTASTYAHSEGYKTTASGSSSHAEGYYAKASGSYSHAEGNNTTASKQEAHSEGYYTKASGNGSHAEGYGSSNKNTEASGTGSHAEGHETTASGSYSHAEGNNTTASGSSSHAEGYYTEASGDYSHTNGYGTIADQDNQFVIGKYNDTDVDALFIIGNGTGTNNRLNVFKVDKQGNTQMKSIEFRNTGTNDGGCIDFHFNNDSSDYTSRIVEDASGIISFYNTHLRIYGTSNHTLINQAYNIDQDTQPSAQIYVQTTTTRDADGNDIGHDEYYQGTNRAIGHNFAAVRQKVNDTTWTWYQCGMVVDVDGTVSYKIASPDAFRTAISAQAALSVQTVTSGIVTAASGVTISAQSYYSYGHVAMLRIAFKVTAAKAATADTTIATISTAARRPINQAGASLFTSTDDRGAWINTNGNCVVRAAIAANTTCYFCATYIIP